jgi:hypothetical protein
MTHRLSLLPYAMAAALLALAATACVGEYRGTATVTASAPDLVLVSPGVYVVEDHHDAVFYSNGFYWRFYDGLWYRSRYYDDSFVRVRYSTVPVRVRRIDRPRAYVRYTGRARAERIKARRHNKHQRANVRDKRRRNRRHR